MFQGYHPCPQDSLWPIYPCMPQCHPQSFAWRSGGQNQRWPTSGLGGYMSPFAGVVPTASKRGAESEVAHKRARWLHNPYHLGGPDRFRAGGGRIRSGPHVGHVAT